MDQARTDFALIEKNLEFLAEQLSRVPTRVFLCRMLLLATASIWALLAARSVPIADIRPKLPLTAEVDRTRSLLRSSLSDSYQKRFL